MTLAELQTKVPPEWQPVVAQYGPAFLAMTGAEILAWLDLCVKGDAYAAFQTLFAKLPNGDLLTEWATLNADWNTANAANAARIAWQKEAAYAILKVLVGIAVAAAGF